MVHMLLAAYVVAGFMVAGVYAWGLLKGSRDHYHGRGSPCRSRSPRSPCRCSSSSGT
ncbi:cytochrome ubiquinol oxidase subunit I [Streptomyces sp. NBC_01166]|uniref:cytochrome ubiquinol oxidase subunit I n=1 Tax=Streptomyces sp. NBC_01166 TaxID=2903755 RepID=UPI0038662C64